MIPRVRIATLAGALAISTASPAQAPPLDVVGPYGTPDDAADGVALPDPASEVGRRHSEFAIERANAAPPDSGLGVGFNLGGGPAHGDIRDGDRTGKDDKPEKPDKPDKPGDDDGDD